MGTAWPGNGPRFRDYFLVGRGLDCGWAVRRLVGAAGRCKATARGLEARGLELELELDLELELELVVAASAALRWVGLDFIDLFPLVWFLGKRRA